MGYFSNGTEGELYEAQYCDRCVHQNGIDGNSSCAVWLLHLIWNYDQGEENGLSAAKSTALELLISYDRDTGQNEQCTMFHSKETADDK